MLGIYRIGKYGTACGY